MLRTTMQIQPMLHLQITFDNFTDIFLFFEFKYLKFYISRILFLRYLYVVSFYRFDYLEQYLREDFNTVSGFHFETKSPISSSHVFYLLIQLNENLKTPFLSLKTSMKQHKPRKLKTNASKNSFILNFCKTLDIEYLKTHL